MGYTHRQAGHRGWWAMCEGDSFHRCGLWAAVAVAYADAERVVYVDAERGVC